MNEVEGFISVEGGNVWYEIVGDSKNVPLLVLHGGPGYPHDYLEPLKDMAINRQVIFYDQLGCGNSNKVKDHTLWTVKHFVTELAQIIERLKLEKYHILGQSWGSALAISFALTKPKGLVSLILSNPYINTSIWMKDSERLIKSLPQNMQDALLMENKESEEYKEASNEFYSRFVFGMDSLPEPCRRARGKMNLDLYSYMWGPEEYKITGTLSDFDPTPRFSEITVPVLLLCGRYDEATPEACEIFKNLLPNAQLIIFEKSAHFPFWNERQSYIQTVNNFLNQ